jgi:hypothetical protein
MQCSTLRKNLTVKLALRQQKNVTLVSKQASQNDEWDEFLKTFWTNPNPKPVAEQPIQSITDLLSSELEEIEHLRRPVSKPVCIGRRMPVDALLLEPRMLPAWFVEMAYLAKPLKSNTKSGS